MAVVVTPAPDRRVEAVDENPLRQTFACADEFSRALLDRCDAGCGRLDEQLALILPDIETEEIEALIDMDDTCLLLGQFQSSLLEELHHQRFDVCFEHCPRNACDDESSHPGEPPPEVLTEPDVNVSAHPALPTQPPDESNASAGTDLAAAARFGAATARPVADAGVDA